MTEFELVECITQLPVKEKEKEEEEYEQIPSLSRLLARRVDMLSVLVDMQLTARLFIAPGPIFVVLVKFPKSAPSLSSFVLRRIDMVGFLFLPSRTMTVVKCVPSKALRPKMSPGNWGRVQKSRGGGGCIL